MSRLDIVIDAGGNNLYRYPRAERPTLQLVVDWAGNAVYVGENGVPGPAGARLGVSVSVDRQGDDRYEGGSRSCGVGVMGIGLLIDHSGNDSYRARDRSLGTGF